MPSSGAGVVAAGAAVLVAGTAVYVVATNEPAGSERDRVVVERVVDGDTVVLGSGETVRLIGIDTPERGRCGYDAATRAMRRLVEGEEVVLVDPDGVQDTDAYDRLLRFIEVDGTDAGLAQLREGRAEARYDSRDGYDRHPREDAYRRAAGRSADPCGRS